MKKMNYLNKIIVIIIVLFLSGASLFPVITASKSELNSNFREIKNDSFLKDTSFNQKNQFLNNQDNFDNSLVEELDQFQIIKNNNFNIYNGRWGAQSFKPSLETLSSIELFISKTGSPTSDITLGIRDSLLGPDLAVVTLSSVMIPTEIDWVSFDFPDIPVVIGDLYYIVVRSSSGDAGSCYNWGFGYSNPYAEGSLWHSGKSGSSWRELSIFDFCFKTYGIVGPTNPMLSFFPSSYDFGSMPIGSTAATSFEIWNSGSGELTYTIGEGCNWLSVDPTVGSSFGEHDIIDVNIDTTGLTTGFYSCGIFIDSNDADHMFTVFVNIVEMDIQLSYNPGMYDFGDMVEGVTDSTSFEIWNSGSGLLSYSLLETCTWVDVSPLFGNSNGEHDIIIVDIDTTGLPLGPHNCDIVIDSNDGSGIFSIFVNIVEFAPELSYNPISHNFGEIMMGNPGHTQFEIWNSGSGELGYSLFPDCGWVEVNPSRGNSFGEHDIINVDVDTTGLELGLHTCNVEIDSNGGTETYTVQIIVIPMVIDELDQIQSHRDNYFNIYNDRWGAQSFIPTMNTLTRVDLYMKKTGSPSSDITISIKDSLTGPDLTSVLKSEGDIPTSVDWLSFDFPDIDIIPGETYFIVFGSNGGSIISSYNIGFSYGNQYPDGSLWYSGDSGTTWKEYINYDLCFKSYGYN